MTTIFKFIFAFAFCIITIGAQCQKSYLISIERKESRKTQDLYFYLEAMEQGTLQEDANMLTLSDTQYRVHFLRLSEPSASSYMGCVKFFNQAAGESLSIRSLLSDSVLTNYNNKQQAIEAECMSLLDNRGRANTVFALRLNDQDRVKMVPIQLDVCSCKTSGDSFSTVSDTLAMVRNIGVITSFSDSEKAYWQNNIQYVLANDFVNSCLPGIDRFARTYQARRE